MVNFFRSIYPLEGFKGCENSDLEPDKRSLQADRGEG